MNSTSFVKELFIARKVAKMPKEKILELQKQRLDALVAYARENSPFYREFYQGLEINPSIESLPAITKSILMENFNNWLTDPELNLKKVDAFLEDYDNIGKFLDNKCIVSKTSGSTGTPCKILSDKKTWNVMNAIHYTRTFSVLDLLKLGVKGAKFFIISNKEFSSNYNSYQEQVFMNIFNKYRCKAVNVDTPTPVIVAELNRFKPSILSVYPTSLQLLIPHIKSGNLKINPDIIVLGGETCSPGLMKEIKANFKSKILDTYGCTEVNMITSQCSEGNMHINIDWVILEPVDRDNNPVPNGVLSDKVLVTNLSNFLQPIIKYEVTDRVIIFDEPCKCGSVMPYLFVEGRYDDMLEFQSSDGIIGISPMVLTDPGDMDGILQFQMIQKDYSSLEVRLLCEESYDKAERFAAVKERIVEILENMEVGKVEVILSDELPKTHPVSGKLKLSIKEM